MFELNDVVKMKRVGSGRTGAFTLEESYSYQSIDSYKIIEINDSQLRLEYIDNDKDSKPYRFYIDKNSQEIILPKDSIVYYIIAKFSIDDYEENCCYQYEYILGKTTNIEKFQKNEKVIEVIKNIGKKLYPKSDIEVKYSYSGGSIYEDGYMCGCIYDEELKTIKNYSFTRIYEEFLIYENPKEIEEKENE